MDPFDRGEIRDRQQPSVPSLRSRPRPPPIGEKEIGRDRRIGHDARGRSTEQRLDLSQGELAIRDAAMHASKKLTFASLASVTRLAAGRLVTEVVNDRDAQRPTAGTERGVDLVERGMA